MYLSFFSQTFTVHRTAVVGGSYLFNSSLPLPLSSVQYNIFCYGSLNMAEKRQDE